MNKAQSKQISGLAGEFLTAGKLLKRGYQVSITLSTAKAIDIFVYNPLNSKTYNLQVKTLWKTNCFPIKRENIHAAHIYVFVLLNGIDKTEDFYIVPGKVILNEFNKFFGASYKDPEKPSSMPAINYGPVKPYKDNWKVFDE